MHMYCKTWENVTISGAFSNRFTMGKIGKLKMWLYVECDFMRSDYIRRRLDKVTNFTVAELVYNLKLWNCKLRHKKEGNAFSCKLEGKNSKMMGLKGNILKKPNILFKHFWLRLFLYPPLQTYLLLNA